METNQKEFMSIADKIKGKLNKKEVLKPSGREIKQAVKSTQSDINIKDVYNGIVIVDNKGTKEYVKILEIKPITYSLRTNNDKNSIYNAFSSIFTVCPTNIQFISMTLPATLKKQIDILEKDMEKEKNESCLKVDEAYKQKLYDSQRGGIQKRFFIVFKYDGKGDEIDVIVGRMRQTEYSIRGILSNCGHEVITEENDSVKKNDQVAEILYTFFNRNEIVDEPYEDRKNERFKTYFEKYNKPDFYMPITELIAPKSVSYLNSKYIVVNTDVKKKRLGTYYSFIYIPGKKYPDVAFPNWLNTFIPSYQGVDISVFFERLDRTEMMGRIRRNLTYTEANASEAKNNSLLADNSQASYEAGSYLKAGMEAGLEMLYMSTIITVSGEYPEEVDEKVETIKNKLKEFYVSVKECKYIEEKAFNSVLPLCNVDDALWDKSKRNVLSDGAATAYMFDDSVMNDEDGIYFGDNADTGSLIVVDLFNTKKFTNPNVFICGQTGAGKTFSLLLMAIRMRMKHIPVFILAPEKEHEFKRVCEALGGQFIQMGAGSPNRINIMEIFKRDEEAAKLIDGSGNGISYLSEKASTLKDFFKLLVKDMTIEEETLLDRAIIETYKRKGITTNNESLIDPDDFFKQKFRKMPIISDLVDVLNEDERTLRIATIISTLCDGSADNFNGQTNVNLNNDFTVIGLEHLKGGMMPLGIYMAMDFVWSKIKEDRTKKKVLFIDEWWKLAYNPVAAEYSLEIAKVIRAYGGAMVIATQQMSDILAVEDGKYGTAVLNNCKTKILMQMAKQDAYVVQDLIGINDTEVNKIIAAERGEGLFVSNDNNCRVRFVASNIEHQLITTDRTELAKIAQANSRDLFDENGNEIIEYDDIFNADDDELGTIEMFDIDEIFTNEEKENTQKEEITEENKENE